MSEIEQGGANIYADLARILRAPCQGAVFQWVRIPPGNFRSDR